MRTHEGRQRALYDEICAGIGDGTYSAGSPLPSTRALAAERGLSRTTVSLVYEQLAAEGFIETRAGAASRVARAAMSTQHLAASRAAAARSAAAPHVPAGLSAIGVRLLAMPLPPAHGTAPGEVDFVYGPLAGHDFPTLLWLKALRGVERQRSERLAYDDPRGNLELRQALLKHLHQTRGISCSIDQLCIVNGSQQAIDLCARLLVDPGDPVVVENPGYRMAHLVFEAQGARLVGVGVDGHGLRTDLLTQVPRARLAYVTPTHQFPLGAFLPIGRRRALLAWAADRDAWIIEDDYDSEYRHSVRPEATLQSLDPQGRVIYVGTFSKTLSPQLRLGYMVLPRQLSGLFATAKRLADRHAPSGIQRALASLLRDGSYDRHVRRMRRMQHARQRALVAALLSHFGDRVLLQGTASGLHLVAWFPAQTRRREMELVRAAEGAGVRVYPIGAFFLPDEEPVEAGRSAAFVMGYAGLDLDQIEDGVRRLAAALLPLLQKAGSRSRR